MGAPTSLTPTMVRSSIITVCLLAVSAPAQPVSYWDATHSQHQTYFTQYSGLGYRVRSLSVYGSSSNPRYAAVWVQESGPNYKGFHGKTANEYQTLVNTHGAQGYRPTIVTVTGSGSSAVFAGILEQDGLAASSVSRHGITEATFDTECSSARSNGRILTWAAAYGTSSSPRFAGIWSPNTNNTPWAYAIGDSDSNFQKRFDAFTPAWVRPQLVTVSNFGQHLSLWHDDKIGAGQTHHGNSQSTFQNYHTTLTAQGYELWRLQAGGSSASSAKFDAIWVKNPSLQSRSWNQTGSAFASLAGFDSYVQGLMQTFGIRAGSLAIVRQGKLVHATGYTWAEPGYPTTQATSLFRLASLSKPLTSIGFHRAIEQGKLTYNTPIASLLGMSATTTPAQANITCDHLLGHLGGWNRSPNPPNYDPMFYDMTISSALGVSMPISKTQIRNYMDQFGTLQAAPGTAYAYSNYGYMLLGQALETVYPAVDYEAVMNNLVFSPLGLTRPQIGASELSKQAPGEVRYHAREPKVYTNRMSSSGDWVNRPYGRWNHGNHDANGGWIMASVDFAKVLAAFDQGIHNPLLTPTTAAAMWTAPNGLTGLPVNPAYGRGWSLGSLPTGSGNVSMYSHTGAFTGGTRTFMLRRADGLSFALFFNRGYDSNTETALWGSTVSTNLNTLANAVTTWPTIDLFPLVGIPSFPACPILTPWAFPPTAASVGSDSWQFTGSGLSAITNVVLSGPGTRETLTRTSPGPNGEGWFSISSSQLRVYPPQGLPLGTYSLYARATGCSSNLVNAKIAAPPTEAMWAPSSVTAGTTFKVFGGSTDAASGTRVMGLFLGTAPVPSTLPGVVSLGIGNNFAALWVWPILGSVSANTHATSWTVPTSASLAGATIYFQGASWDAAAPVFPMVPTNVVSTTLQ